MTLRSEGLVRALTGNCRIVWICSVASRLAAYVCPVLSPAGFGIRNKTSGEQSAGNLSFRSATWYPDLADDQSTGKKNSLKVKLAAVTSYSA